MASIIVYADLEKAAQERNVIGPFLQRSIEQGQCPLDGRGIPPVILVFFQMLCQVR